jgi:acyl carrier protein
MNATIREILAKFGQLPTPVDTIENEADLYAAGLSSFASVQLMLGIEEAFDIEFPDNLLKTPLSSFWMVKRQPDECDRCAAG